MPSETRGAGWTVGPFGTLSQHLLFNGLGYPIRRDPASFGWDGPYTSPDEVGPDPWNNRYLVNVGLLDASQGPQAASGTVKSAVWVISAGPNGILETPFNQSIASTTVPGGDDIGARLQ